MKKYINRILGMILILFVSCQVNDPVLLTDSDGDGKQLLIRMKVPGAHRLTKAVSEDLLESVQVLIFENRAGSYQFVKQVTAYNLIAQALDEYTFYARVPATDNPVKLYLLGNVSTASDVIPDNATETAIRQLLVRNFTTAGFDGSLPMFGELEFTSGIPQEGAQGRTSMVRSVARADIASSTTSFELTTVQVFRASNSYQLIPDVMSNFVVTDPSIPSGTLQNVNLPPVNAINGISTAQIYLPESPLPDASDRQSSATILVVGGKYDGSTTDTYYRLDFIPDTDADLFGQILRNHLYSFEITEALAPGWETPEEAARYGSSQLEVVIKVWDENTVSMVFDAVNYFGVSSRTFRLNPTGGAQQSISVDTNLDTYELYWSDANGAILDDDSIEPGGSFPSPDGRYTAEISDDGTQITVTSVGVPSETNAYLLAGAGRLRILLTIEQGTATLIYRDLRVYGYTGGVLGNFGDFVYSTIPPNERATQMVQLMQNSTNFGPDGTFKIPQITIGGNTAAPPSINFMEMYDVWYLTYSINPIASTTEQIINWNNQDNKLLFIQYDNSTTNGNVLTQLGITDPTFPTSREAFTISQYAPDEIINGVFGSVNPDMTIRCRDTTHGEIPVETALANNITPILIGGGGGMVLGIDMTKLIVYSGDIDIYNNNPGDGFSGDSLSGNGTINNDVDKLIANLWAWIATVTLTVED